MEHTLLPATIGVYEWVVWVLAPKGFSTHNRPDATPTGRTIVGVVNSLPHVLAALAPSAPLTEALYTPFLFTFTSVQAYNWIVPWLGVRHSTTAVLRRGLRTSGALLGPPALPSSALRPSLEHTILFAMSVVALRNRFAASPPSPATTTTRVAAAAVTALQLTMVGSIALKACVAPPPRAEDLEEEDRDAVGAPWERIAPALVLLAAHLAFAVRTYNNYFA
jgi:hypothetical protein